MKAATSSYALIVLIILVSASCSKPPPQSCAEPCQPINTVDLKDWHFFQEGTTWIYEEINSGLKDTVEVVDADAFTDDEGLEYWDFTAYHSYSQTFTRQWSNDTWSGPCPDNTVCDCARIFRSKYADSEFIGESWLFTFPQSEESYLYLAWPVAGEHNRSSVTALQDSVEVLPGVYSDVAIWGVDYDPLFEDQSTEYHLAKGLGIAKLKIPEEEQEWVLIECDIVQ